MTFRLKKVLLFGAISVLTLCLTAFSCVFANAEEPAATLLTNAAVTPNYRNLKDDNVNTFSSITELKITSDTAIDSVYIRFWNETPNYTLSCGGVTHAVTNEYLHSFTLLPDTFTDAKEITVTFEKQINVSDVFAFTEGKLPDWVHVWKAPYDKADIMLNSTHADDEHLFFAGVLPYHVAKDYRVQVVYFTDHNNTPGRRHELLNGLWTVGVDHYPVISRFPDAYSTSAAGALANVKYAGFTEDDLLAYQTEMLRRFKPQVVVGHDPKGEYGHGQHMLNTETLLKAAELAKDAANYPDSAEKYGVWDTPKLYLHSYTENQITLNWDEPLDRFGGMTAYQMSREAYKTHHSQQYTWFTDWLRGPNGSFTSATQIKTYSPCVFGLARTTVGEDVEKNSFFENLISYDEQIRLEQERLEKERQEQLRREEESRVAESERLESIRVESERVESLRIAESESIELERQRLEALENKKSAQTKGIIAAIILVAAIASLAVVIINKRK